MSEDAAGAPGWFGKLACLGDFASRRLPTEFVTACDNWLSHGVEKSRSQLGEIWLDTYLTSPLWRFAWAPGIVDERWWFGVMMPSVDNVGRYFPLVVALPRNAAPFDGEDLDALERWFEEVADSMLGTLQDGASVDGFERGLSGAAPLLDHPGATSPSEAVHWTNRTGYRFAGSSSLGNAMHELLQHDAAQRFNGRTLWWHVRTPNGDNHLTVATGLPTPESFVDLLQGAW